MVTVDGARSRREKACFSHKVKKGHFPGSPHFEQSFRNVHFSLLLMQSMVIGRKFREHIGAK